MLFNSKPLNKKFQRQKFRIIQGKTPELQNDEIHRVSYLTFAHILRIHIYLVFEIQNLWSEIKLTQYIAEHVHQCFVRKKMTDLYKHLVDQVPFTTEKCLIKILKKFIKIWVCIWWKKSRKLQQN